MHLFAMCSMVLVLGCIVAVINIMNYRNVNEDADRTLNIISDNGGVFPKDFSDQEDMQGQKPDALQTFFSFLITSVVVSFGGIILFFCWCLYFQGLLLNRLQKAIKSRNALLQTQVTK